MSLNIREKLLSKFKKIWYEDYLLSLRETCRNIHQLDFCNKVKLNDIVLIKNPLKPKPYWSLGRIIELFPGSDNNIRSVKLALGNRSEVIHSLKNLYPLELSLTHNTDYQNVSNVIHPELSNSNLKSSFQDINDSNLKSSFQDINKINLKDSFQDINGDANSDSSIKDCFQDIESEDENLQMFNKPIKDNVSIPSGRPKRKTAGKLNERNNSYYYYY